LRNTSAEFINDTGILVHEICASIWKSKNIKLCIILILQAYANYVRFAVLQAKFNLKIYIFCFCQCVYIKKMGPISQGKTLVPGERSIYVAKHINDAFVENNHWCGLILLFQSCSYRKEVY